MLCPQPLVMCMVPCGCNCDSDDPTAEKFIPTIVAAIQVSDSSIQVSGN